MARENKRTRDERRFGKPERLADVVLSGKWRLPYWCSAIDDEFTKFCAGFMEDVLFELASTKVVVADNVCEFLYADNPKERWEYDRDFPCCAPPVENLLIEMGRPSRILSGDDVKASTLLPDRWGWLFKFKGKESLIEHFDSRRDEIMESLRKQCEGLFSMVDVAAIERAATEPDGKVAFESLGDVEKTYLTLGRQYVQMKEGVSFESKLPAEMKWAADALLLVNQGDVVVPMAEASLCLTESGRIIDYPAFKIFGGIQLKNPQLMVDIKNTSNSMLFPALLALSFMHCKNVIQVECQPDAGINRERRRAGLKPFVRYHTIDIEPMKKVLKIAGQVESNGLKKALHICRGHFSTYSEEKPLFGRVAGTFWIPSHVRGSVKQGVVLSDYKVNRPKEVTA